MNLAQHCPWAYGQVRGGEHPSTCQPVKISSTLLAGCTPHCDPREKKITLANIYWAPLCTRYCVLSTFHASHWTPTTIPWLRVLISFILQMTKLTGQASALPPSVLWRRSLEPQIESGLRWGRRGPLPVQGENWGSTRHGGVMWRGMDAQGDKEHWCPSPRRLSFFFCQIGLLLPFLSRVKSPAHN